MHRISCLLVLVLSGDTDVRVWILSILDHHAETSETFMLEGEHVLSQFQTACVNNPHMVEFNFEVWHR